MKGRDLIAAFLVIVAANIATGVILQAGRRQPILRQAHEGFGG